MSHEDNSYYFGNSFFNLFKKGNDAYTQTPQIQMPYNTLEKGPQFVSVNGKENEIFRTTPHLNAVISRRASMLSNGVFIHYDRNGEIIENSELVQFLNKPNLFQKKNEWLMQQDIQKCVHGNAFIFIFKPSELQDIPFAIWNLPSEGMIINRTGLIWKQKTEEDIIKSYDLNVSKKTGIPEETFLPSEILHRNIQDPTDPIMGTSPFHALRMPISNTRSAYGFRNVIMTEKGGLGFISNESKNTTGALPLTDDERIRLERQFSEGYGISDKQRKIMMTSASLKWNPMGFPTKEMMLFEEVDENTRAFIDQYGLNQALFSLGKGTTFDNYYQGLKAAYQDTIIPEGEDLANGLTYKLGLAAKGERLELSYSHLPILQDDQSTESDIVRVKSEALNLLVANQIPLSEARSIVKLDE